MDESEVYIYSHHFFENAHYDNDSLALIKMFPPMLTKTISLREKIWGQVLYA
jgi:hypothetical protein